MLLSTKKILLKEYNNNNNMKFLIKAENVILTPHIAGLSFESKKGYQKY